MFRKIPHGGRRSMVLIVLLLGVVAARVRPIPAESADQSGAEAVVRVESVDLRPALQELGLPTRSQGKRGTCSVFALAGAIEYAVAEKGQPATRLSIEFLNWGSNRTINRFKDGGFFSDLWKGFEAYGICPEEEMPYRTEFDPSLQPSPQALERAARILKAGLELHWIKRWNPHQGLTPEQLDAVKETLRRRKPVCGGFLWPKNARWVDGVLQMAPREGVRDGHSVLIVGFREDPSQPGGGVFLVRNTSKGPREAAMSYRYVRAYMNDAVWIGRGGKSSSQ